MPNNHKKTNVALRSTLAGGAGSAYDLNDSANRTLVLHGLAALNDGYHQVDGVDVPGEVHSFPDGYNWINSGTANSSFANASAANCGFGTNTNANAALLGGSMRLSSPIQLVVDPGDCELRMAMGHASSTMSGTIGVAIFDGEAGALRTNWDHYNVKTWSAGMSVNGGLCLISTIDRTVWKNGSTGLVAGSLSTDEPRGTDPTYTDSNGVIWTRVDWPDGEQVVALHLLRATLSGNTPNTVINADGTPQHVNTWGNVSVPITVGGARGSRLTFLPLQSANVNDIRSISLTYKTPFTLANTWIYDRAGYDRGVTPDLHARDPASKPLYRIGRENGLSLFRLTGDMAPYLSVQLRGTEYWIYTSGVLIPDALAGPQTATLWQDDDDATNAPSLGTVLTFNVISSQGKPITPGDVNAMIRTTTWLYKKRVQDLVDARTRIAPDNETADVIVTVSSLAGLADAMHAIPQPADGRKYEIIVQGSGTWSGYLTRTGGGSPKPLDMGTGWLRIKGSPNGSPKLNIHFSTYQRHVRWTGLSMPNDPELRNGEIFTLLFDEPGRGGINGVAGRFNKVLIDHCEFGMAFATNYHAQSYGAGFIQRSTGERVRLTSTTGLPAPLQADTDYWIIKIGVGDVQLAATYADALARIPIDITTTDPSKTKIKMTFPDISLAILVGTERIGDRVYYKAPNNACVAVDHAELVEFDRCVFKANRGQLSIAMTRLLICSNNDSQWSRNDWLQTSSVNHLNPKPSAYTYDVFGDNNHYISLTGNVSRNEIDFAGYANLAHTDWWQNLRALNSHDWQPSSTKFYSSGSTITSGTLFVYWTPNEEARVYKVTSATAGQAFGSSPPTGTAVGVKEMNGTVEIEYQYDIVQTNTYMHIENNFVHSDGPLHMFSARQWGIVSSVRRAQKHFIASINNMQGGPTTIGYQIGEGELHCEFHVCLGPSNLGGPHLIWQAGAESPPVGTFIAAEDNIQTKVFQVVVQGTFGSTRPADGTSLTFDNGTAKLVYVGSCGAAKPKAYSQGSADLYIENCIMGQKPSSNLGNVYIGDQFLMLPYDDPGIDPNEYIGSGTDFVLQTEGIFRDIWHYPSLNDDGANSIEAFKAEMGAMGSPITPNVCGLFVPVLIPPTAYTLAALPGDYAVGQTVPVEVALNYPATAETIVSLAKSGAASTLSSDTVTFEVGEQIKMVNVTGNAIGTVILTPSDNRGLTDPAALEIDFIAAPIAPTLVQVLANRTKMVMGQTVRISFPLDKPATVATTISYTLAGVAVGSPTGNLVIEIGENSTYIDVIVSSPGMLTCTITNDRGLANPAPLNIPVNGHKRRGLRKLKLLRG